jgi:hypothetical protein
MLAAMELSSVCLGVPGTAHVMCVAPDTEVTSLAGNIFDKAAIVVGYGPNGPTIGFDANVLELCFGTDWKAIEDILQNLDPDTIQDELRSMEEHGPLSDAAAPLAAAEARLIEGPDAAASAVLVLVCVQARIAAVLEGSSPAAASAKRRSL